MEKIKATIYIQRRKFGNKDVFTAKTGNIVSNSSMGLTKLITDHTKRLIKQGVVKNEKETRWVFAD